MGRNANKEGSKTTESNNEEYILIEVPEATINSDEEQSRSNFTEPSAKETEGQKAIGCDSSTSLS